MSWDPAAVEALVRRVVAELGAAAPAAEEEGRGARGEGRETNTRTDELVLGERLVTLAHLEGRLNGVTRVVTPARAIVTPAVRDELRRRGVELSEQVTANGSTKKSDKTVATTTATSGEPTVCFGIADTNFDAAGLVRTLARRASVQRLAQAGLKAAVTELADQAARGGALGVLITGSAAAAVVLANRQRGVRAVFAGSMITTERDCRAIGANLLVIDPASRSYFETQRLTEQFVQRGHVPPPDYLRDL